MTERPAEAGTDLEVAWLGHATVDVRLGGARFVTDPVLRDRVAHLRRFAGRAWLDPGPIDAVLVSHLHHDHFDLPSLRRLPPGTPIVVPRGAGRLVGRAAAAEVVEVAPGEVFTVAGVTVTVVPAEHAWGRALRRVRAAPIGFLLERDGRRVYFPGDTDLHSVMAELPAPDVALLPIGGWGSTVGDGHLDPIRAAEAAGVLRARAVLPIHWGTFAPLTPRRGAPAWLDRPAARFSAALCRGQPDVDLHLVAPGSDPVRFPTT